MKKIFLLLIPLLLINLAEAAVVSLTVSWQLSVDTLRPGSDATISLTLTNAGGVDITNAVVKAAAGPHIKITSGGKNEFGGIPATISHQGAVSIEAEEDAPSTTSYVLLDIDYWISTSQYDKSIYIPITIRRKPILEIRNVQYDDSTEPGKTVLLSFDIFNSGDGPAEDLKIILNQTDLFTTPGSSGEIVVNDLEKLTYQHLEFRITIDPDASIGINKIPVKLSYYDETKSTLYSETKYIGLTVSGDVEFVTTVEGGENFYFGRSGTIEISIANRGTANAEYLTIKAYSDFGSKEFYIGSLEPDDYEIIDIPQVLTGAPAKYPIYLDLMYKDEFNNEYNVTKTVEAIPTHAPIDFTWIIIIVILCIIGFWYYKRKKKK